MAVKTSPKAILTGNGNNKPFTKSRKRTSLAEFAFVNNIRPEVIAGFKVWLKGDLYHFDNEWEFLFKEYSNR